MTRHRIDVHHHVLPDFFREAQTAGGYPSTAYRPFPDRSPGRDFRGRFPRVRGIFGWNPIPSR